MYPVYEKNYSKQLAINWLVGWQVTIVYWIKIGYYFLPG